MDNHIEEGPDRVIPAESLWTCSRDGAVRIRPEDDEDGHRKVLPFLSIPTCLARTTEKYPERVAMAVKRDGEWVKWTYPQYLKDVRTCAKAFVHLGLERLGTVAILGANAPEWFIGDLGAIFAGGIAYGIYPTNSSEACFHSLAISETTIVLVEDEKQLAKILPLRSKLPHLKAVIQYAGNPSQEGVHSWSQLMYLGSQQPDSLVDDRLKDIAVNQCCCLIFTSGTTGMPKAVMISHDNVTWILRNFAQVLGISTDDEHSIISYLPLSHVAAQFTDIYCPVYTGATVYFAGKDALKGSLIHTLREVRPTLFIGVPRVWEKMYEKFLEKEKAAWSFQKSLLNWAKGLAWENMQRRMNGNTNPPLGFGLAKWLILHKIQQELGLDRAMCLTGAAPLSLEVMQYFASMNILLLDVFGMSESSGPLLCATESNFRLGTTGRPLSGIKIKIDKPDSDGSGEICSWGRNVFMGYLNNEEETKKVLDEEGWLYTGDVGAFDADGYLKLTGRIKEILITAGGENIPAPMIELAIKAELPCLSHAVLIGDKKKFLSVLLTMSATLNPITGEPQDTLAPEAKSWLQSLGSSASTISELIESDDPRVTAAIEAGIDRANKKAISSAQKVQKWAILQKDFSVLDGELSPTFKVRRHVVAKRFADVIDSFYLV